MAINMHGYGGLGANWWVCGGHIDERLAKGKKTNFEYGVGACAAALRDARDGRQGGDDLPTAEHAADSWRAAAFTESVKCSPSRKASKPSDAMWRNCPSLLLERELRILRPDAVLVMGRSNAAPRVGELLESTVTDRRPGFERMEGKIDGRPIEVFACNHPNFQQWRTSYGSLMGSLAGQAPFPVRG